jgi:hypothetical protein
MRSRGLRDNKAIVPYVITMIVVVVGVDILFLRHHFAPRLIVNIGIGALIWGRLSENAEAVMITKSGAMRPEAAPPKRD